MVSILKQFCAELFDVFQSTLSCQIPNYGFSQPYHYADDKLYSIKIHLRTQLQHRHGQGRKLPLTNRSIHRHTTNRRLVHNNHTALHPWTNRKPSNPRNHTRIMGVARKPSTLTSGQIWINVTTTDAFNRTTVDTYTYLIDGEVTSTPTLSIIGSNTILANQTLLGPNSRLRLGNLVDAGGVGFSEVQCYKNGQSSPTIYTSITDITPSGAPGQSDNYTISCRIKDQVGNYGPYTNFSGVVDLTKPTINYAPAQGSTITDNTTLTITSTDDKINGSSTATITWTSSDGSATWNTTVNYNGDVDWDAQRVKRKPH